MSKRHDLKNLRQRQAKERAEARASRTDEDQLARLDEMLGEGLGAARERAMLTRRIDDRKAAKK